MTDTAKTALDICIERLAAGLFEQRRAFPARDRDAWMKMARTEILIVLADAYAGTADVDDECEDERINIAARAKAAARHAVHDAWCWCVVCQDGILPGDMPICETCAGPDDDNLVDDARVAYAEEVERMTEIQNVARARKTTLSRGHGD